MNISYEVVEYSEAINVTVSFGCYTRCCTNVDYQGEY